VKGLFICQTPHFSVSLCVPALE